MSICSNLPLTVLGSHRSQPIWSPGARSDWSKSVSTAESTYWIERRPQEGGRKVIVRRSADGKISDVTPVGFNARTRVHEYGGGDYAVADGLIIFSNFADQRLYRQELGSEPKPLTPQAPLRYADGQIDRRRNRSILCARRSHLAAVNRSIHLVRIDLSAGDDCGHRVGKRFLFFAAPEPRRLIARMAYLESPQHAVGRHGTLAR